MDDSNIPSLQSMPLYKTLRLSAIPGIYKINHTAFLSTTPRPGLKQYNSDPYCMHGPLVSAVGSPHEGTVYA
ncbi:MAG: hypothetical protein STHCBS139747_000746 [Sporothrix thermara]